MNTDPRFALAAIDAELDALLDIDLTDEELEVAEYALLTRRDAIIDTMRNSRHNMPS